MTSKKVNSATDSPEVSNKVTSDDRDSQVEQTLEKSSAQSKTPSKRRVIGRRPISPDGGWGWVVVAGSFFIHVFADGFVYSFGVIVAELLEQFEGGHAFTGWIISLLLGLTLGIGPIASAITNRYGCRFATILGAFIASFGCGISFFADSLLFLMLSVGLIMGFGFGLMYCPAIVVVTMYFERRRGFATGIAVCGAGFGTFIFAPLSQIMIDHYGWRGTLLIYSAIILNCAVCGALFRPLEFEDVYEEELDEVEIDADLEAITRSRSHLGSIREMPQAAARIEPERRLTQDPHEPIGRPHESMTLENGMVVQLESAADDEDDDVVDNETPNAKSVATRLLNGETRGTRAQSHMILPSDAKFPSSKRPSLRQSISVAHGGRGERHARSESHGYLNIKDVFYAGSTQHLAEYKQSRSTSNYYRSINALHHHHGNHETSVAYKRQISSVKGALDVIESITEGSEDSSSPETCSQFKRVVSEMVDFSLFTSMSFLLFTISNFLTSVGFNPPLIFLPDKAVHLGIDRSTASFMLSIFGMSNTAGRLIFGFISDKEFPFAWGKNTAANRLWIYNLLITLCGLSTIWVCFTNSTSGLMLYSALFGVSISAYVCLTSVLLVDLMGLDKLTNAFGLLLLFQGIASVLGAPVADFAGFIYDYTQNYDYSFMFCGISLLISGVMLYVLPFIRQSRETFALSTSEHFVEVKTA